MFETQYILLGLIALYLIIRVCYQFYIRKNIGPVMGIDIGTSHTRVYVKGRGVVLNEPSVVAFSYKKGRKVPHAIGADAKALLGPTTRNIEILGPMKDGVVADFEVAENMLKYFFMKALGRRFLIRSC